MNLDVGLKLERVKAFPTGAGCPMEASELVVVNRGRMLCSAHPEGEFLLRRGIGR